MTDSGPPEETSDSSDPIANGGPGTLLDPDVVDPDAELSSPQSSIEPVEPVEPAEPGEPAEPVEPAAPAAPAAPARPGLRTFSLEHRIAPGLYLVAWLSCLLGGGLLIVSVLTSSSLGRTIMLVGALVLLSLGLTVGAGQQALERRARGWTGYGGPSPFLVFAAAVPTSLLLSVLFAFVLSLLQIDFSSAAGIVAASLATAIPFVGLVRLLVVGTGALTWRELGFLPRDADTARGILAAVLWGVAIVFGTVLLATILSTVLPVAPSPLPLGKTAPERIAALVVLMILAPVSEEIVFRGFATTAWARTMPRRAAILRSGLFFAFIHVLTISGAATFQQGLGFAAFAFLGRIPVSLALAAIFLRRGSIYESFALHATFNGLPIVLLLIANP